MTTTAPVAQPTVAPGSDEADVYDCIAAGVTTLAEVEKRTGFPKSRVADCATRLRKYGLIRFDGRFGGEWRVGRDPGLKVLIGCIGVDSATLRMLKDGRARAASEIAIELGCAVQSVLSKLSRIVDQGRAERVEPKRKDGEQRFRLRISEVAPDGVVPIFGFVPGDGHGEGDRREDCVRYERCLKNYKLGGQAHCPQGCCGYQKMPEDRDLVAATRQRDNQWTAMGY